MNNLFFFFSFIIFQFVSNPTEIKVAQVEQKADQIENKKQIEHSKPTPVEHSA